MLLLRPSRNRRRPDRHGQPLDGVSQGLETCETARCSTSKERVSLDGDVEKGQVRMNEQEWRR